MKANIKIRVDERNDRRKASALQRHILIVDDLLPDPLFGAGYPRAHAIVMSLVGAGHHVTYYPMVSSSADSLRMHAAFDGTVDFRAGEGARGLRRLLWRHGASFDTIFISRPGPMQAFVDAQWQSVGHELRPIVIYDAEAVLSPREKRRRILFGIAWSSEEYQSALISELSLASCANKITAVGRGDAEIISQVIDVPVFVLPHVVACRDNTPKYGERRDLLFVGRLTGESQLIPNVDSVIWFITKVMPLLDTLIGKDYCLHIAGLTSSQEIEGLISDRIVLHGVVENLEPLYDQCRVFIAPTRFAAGIPLKVIEAMGQGIPCVATPLLEEQLGTSQNELLSGGSAEAFAVACKELYDNENSWQQIQQSALGYVFEHYSRRAFDRIVEEVIAGGHAIVPHAAR